jgi:hypothetical protein
VRGTSRAIVNADQFNVRRKFVELKKWPITLIQIVLNVALAFVPIAIFMFWQSFSLPVFFASPLLWIGSFLTCVFTIRPRRYVFLLLLLLPIVFVPVLYGALLCWGFKYRGI